MAKIPTFISWAWGENTGCVEVVLPKKIDRLKKVILLNAPVLPKKIMSLVAMPSDLENVKELVRIAEKVESYIGHESTAKLLSELLETPVPYNRSEYQPVVGDIAVVVRLKKRLEKPEDVKNVKLEDIEFYIVNYYEDFVPKFAEE
jgi:hypothetical protein